MIGLVRDELARLATVEERHRRLAARLGLLAAATLVVDMLGAVAMYVLERGAAGTQVQTFGQALFFSTVQLLTVSSSARNPVTPLGRAVDVLLELWGVVAVAGSAGAIATFFFAGDSR